MTVNGGGKAKFVKSRGGRWGAYSATTPVWIAAEVWGRSMFTDVYAVRIAA